MKKVAVLSGTAIVCIAGIAFADGSPARFHPATSGDAANIHFQGTYVWNQSTAGPATVVADLGVVRIIGGGNYSVVVYGYTQGHGANSTCTLTASSMMSANRFASAVTTLGNGTIGNYNTTVTMSAPPSNLQPYAFELICSLAALQPGNGAEQLWGYENGF